MSHSHVFLGDRHDRNARATLWVIGLTSVMMVAEIAAGTAFNSMALTADGWHMSTHAAAMAIAALAYAVARREANNPRFTFGTGKLGELAGFASAVLLMIIALLIGFESLMRLYRPVTISFGEAIIVAVVGLAVNIVSALILREGPDHHQEHHHEQGHAHEGHGHTGGHDHNLRAAYLHVITDALTSVLAIFALVAGSFLGWAWLDPIMGVVGALIIAQWSIALIRDAGAVLVDYLPDDEALPDAIREALNREGDEIVDLHVWQVGPGQHGAIIAITSRYADPPDTYRARLAHLNELRHVTVEISPLP
jgi:cation diffusion facilitator family transporter